MNRREWMTALTLAACGVRSSQAQPVARLRLGVDGLVFDTGLAAKWKATMGRDVGLGVDWVRSTTADVLTGLDNGSMQAGLFFSCAQADTLSRQGLIHDRHPLARTGVLLVGPQDDLAGIGSEQDVGKVMHQILAGQAAGACRFESPARGSGLDGLSERLQAGLAVKQLPQARAPSSQVASQPAYQLLTSGQWQALPAPQRKRMKVILNQDPRLTLTCEVARSFRSAHPAGKLMVQWLQGPLGRRAVAASGWQPA